MNNRFCAGIIVRHKKVLLLERSEKEDEPHKWCPINGGIEDNEEPEQAVIREAREETGLDFRIIKSFPAPVYKKDITFVFLGIGKGQIKLNPEEVVSYGWFSYRGAISLNFAYGYDQVIKKLFELKLIK